MIEVLMTKNSSSYREETDPNANLYIQISANLHNIDENST